MDVHEAVAERLRSVGQRYSNGRRELVDVLGESGPLTIDAIRRRRDLPLSSLYRNLAALEEAGVVRRVPSHDDTAHYELSEELDEHHHHLLCTSCGSVTDFVMPAALEKALHRAVAAAADDAGFEASGHSVELTGTCVSCRKRAK